MSDIEQKVNEAQLSHAEHLAREMAVQGTAAEWLTLEFLPQAIAELRRLRDALCAAEKEREDALFAVGIAQEQIQVHSESAQESHNEMCAWKSKAEAAERENRALRERITTLEQAIHAFGIEYEHHGSGYAETKRSAKLRALADGKTDG